MLASDLALALDPVLYARAAGLELDPWQASVTRSRAPRMSLCITRQGGKSTSVSVRAAHLATYQPDALVLLLAPGLRQAQELFRKCQTVLHRQARPVRPVSETKSSLELPNRSRIISLPGQSEDTIRGYSGPALVCFDEAARVPDDTYNAVRPMLARSGGQIILLSTPFGQRGFFWREHVQAAPGLWERYTVPVGECPHISAEFLAGEREALGEYWYDQEYNLAWHSPENAAFQRAYIDAAIDEGVEQWDLINSGLEQHLAARS